MRAFTPVAVLVVLGLLGCLLGCEPGRLGRSRRPSALDHGDQELATDGMGIADVWRRIDGWAVSEPIAAPEGATRASAFVRLLSADAPPPNLMARGLIGGEAVTDWVPLAPYFAEGDTHVTVAELPLSAEAVELWIPEAELESLAELRWSAVDPALFVEDEEPTDEGVALAALTSELSGLGIVPRETWGARSGSCSSRDGGRARISIHHTEGPASDPERQLRGIQSYHMSKGWCDVGYHFLIDTTGRIYEGRRVELLGAHVRDNNRGNLGIALIGCFDGRECATPTPITDAMIESAGRLVGTLSRIYGITPSSSTVRGHRDQVSTTCPGDRLYARLPDIIRIGATSSLDGGAPPPADPPPPPASGSVCSHSYGGTYASGACSESYQCCDGTWRSRGGCGACTCVEATGRVGCTSGGAPVEPPPEPPPPPPPPAGAGCAHSFGGSYAHTACSASYQCCDGSWSSRGGCGACLCVEESGESGCGTTSAPPPAGSTTLPWAGLSLSGSEIPRAGLANATLRAALGVSVEPYGTVESYEGSRFVRGRVSHFGGPRDTGVTSTETGAITGERLRALNDPLSPSSSTLASRPEDFYYVAMRWAYSPNGTRWWRDARLLVVNPATGAAIVVRPVDWGPHTRTARVLDLSPQALTDLGLSTDGEALVAFAPAGTPLGRIR